MGAEQKKESIGSVMPDTGEGGALNIMETLVLTPSSFLPLLSCGGHRVLVLFPLVL